MARPKSDDPKRAVTLRLPSSVVARFEAMGDGWRSKMEQMITGDQVGAVSAPLAREQPQGSAVHVAIPLYERKAFNPRPKTGKSK